MGMAYAYAKGDMKEASPSIKRIAKSFTKKGKKKGLDNLRHFASTKHDGLPEKIGESILTFRLFVESTQLYYSEISIGDFINYLSDDNPYQDVTNGILRFGGMEANINVNRSENKLNKSIDFNESDINAILKLDFKDNNYKVDINNNMIIITDIDINRESINKSLIKPSGKDKGKVVTGKNFGNTDSIWLYKSNDDWFFVVIARSNIIPFGRNRQIMANRNNNFKYFKCDQIDGLLKFLKEKLYL